MKSFERFLRILPWLIIVLVAAVVYQQIQINRLIQAQPIIMATPTPTLTAEQENQRDFEIYTKNLIKDIEECKNDMAKYGGTCSSSGTWNDLMELGQKPAEACMKEQGEGMILTSDGYIGNKSFSRWPETTVIDTDGYYEVEIVFPVDRVWLDNGFVYFTNGLPDFVQLPKADKKHGDYYQDEQIPAGDTRVQPVVAEALSLSLNWQGSMMSTFVISHTGKVLSIDCANR